MKLVFFCFALALVSCGEPVPSGPDNQDIGRVEYVLDTMQFLDSPVAWSLAPPEVDGRLVVTDDFRYEIEVSATSTGYLFSAVGKYQFFESEIIYTPDDGSRIQRSGKAGPEVRVVGVGRDNVPFEATFETIRTPVPDEVRQSLVGSWRMTRFGSFDATGEIVVTFAPDGRYSDVRHGALSTGEPDTLTHSAAYGFLNGSLVVHRGTSSLSTIEGGTLLVERQKFPISLTEDTLVLTGGFSAWGYPGMSFDERAREPIEARERVYVRIR